MGFPTEMRDAWVNQISRSIWVASPSEDARILRAKQRSQEAALAGLKAASIACVASAIPTLIAVRVSPWAKRNLNYTAQALIVSSASIAAYFITADKHILESARSRGMSGYDKSV